MHTEIDWIFFSYLCGGECLEDINALIEQFRQRPGTQLPGADTVGRGLKELAEENIVYKSEISGKSYSFNAAEKLNTLLLRMIRQMGLIKVGSHVDLDFDHQFIPAHKFDAKYSYKLKFPTPLFHGHFNQTALRIPMNVSR